MYLGYLYILCVNYLKHRFIKCLKPQFSRILIEISMEINSKQHLVQFIDHLSARVLNIML